MRPVGMHIAFDPADSIGGHTAVTLVASNGRGQHATMVVKFSATDPRHSNATSEQLVGRALQEFGSAADLGRLQWINEEDTTQEQQPNAADT